MGLYFLSFLIGIFLTANLQVQASIPADWMDGAWGKRIKITINKSQVNGSVLNIPVYINLNDLPASFFDDALINGADLRVTKSDGLTQVAREIVFLNKTSNAGELFFMANGTLSNSANGIFYLYYNNPAASEPAANAAYGKYNVWSQSNYAAVWHMQENPAASAPQILDSTSYGYNGTSSGSMTLSDSVTCKVNNCLDFDAVDDYIDTADISQIDNATQLTFTMWFKRRTATSNILMGKGISGSTTNRIEVQIWSDGLAWMAVNTSANERGRFATSDANWHYFTEVFNGSGIGNTGRLQGYLDGVNQTLTYTGTVGAAFLGNSNNFYIGRRAFGATYADGFMDEIRISTKARNPNWIKTEYNNQNSPSTFYSVGSVYALNPEIASFSPTDNSTGVALSTNLVLTFDRQIDIQTGNIYIKKLSDNTIVQTIAVNSGALSGNGTTQITVNPPSDLGSLTAYYITVDATAFDDTDANSYAGITSNGTWNFTTMNDIVAPTISSFSPLDDATSVSVSSDLIMNFSESIDIQTGSLVIYNSGGSIFESIDVTSGALSGNGTSAITINPTSNFADYASYYVLVNSGVFKDLSGNSYTGIAASTTWSFTTSDLNGPTVLHYSPPQSSISQQRYAGLRLIFNEVIQKGAGNIVIKQVSDNSTVASVNVASSTVAVNGNQLFVQMPDKLPEGTEFYIQMTSGLVKDSFNNDYAGIADTTSWRFSTNASENSLFL